MRLLLLIFCLCSSPALAQQVELVYYKNSSLTFQRLAKTVERRTSLSLHAKLRVVDNFHHEAWLWTKEKDFADPHALAQWLKKGGMLIVMDSTLPVFTKHTFPATQGKWQTIPLDNALLRSFYLLDVLPACKGKDWQGFIFNERLAIVSIPYPLLAFLSDQRYSHPCLPSSAHEKQTRIFINLLMVALATDYKKDQVHLPEILKRLR